MAQSRGTYTSLVPSLLPTAAGHSGILLDPNQTLPGSAIHCAGVVASMLQHKLLPRQGQEVGEGMCQVLLEFVGRESHSMHHVVINVDLLNADVGKGWQREFQSKVCTSSNVLGMLPRKHSRTESSHTATRKWPSTHSTCTPSAQA